MFGDADVDGFSPLMPFIQMLHRVPRALRKGGLFTVYAYVTHHEGTGVDRASFQPPPETPLRRAASEWILKIPDCRGLHILILLALGKAPSPNPQAGTAMATSKMLPDELKAADLHRFALRAAQLERAR